MRPHRQRSFVLRLVLLGAAMLGGCTHVLYSPRPGMPDESAPQSPGRYEALFGRDAQTVAELRAAPPPAQPEVADGQSPAGDEHVLAAKGFVHIGDAHYAGSEVEAREWLVRMAHQVGADKMLVYAAPVSADATAPALQAAYYVHFKLPFGAKFRDLTAAERDTLGGSGVQLGAVIGGSPAAEANLRSGDFVLQLDGEAVRDRAGFERLLRAHMGKRVTLTISRDGVTTQRLVRLGVLPGDMGAPK